MMLEWQNIIYYTTTLFIDLFMTDFIEAKP